MSQGEQEKKDGEQVNKPQIPSNMTSKVPDIGNTQKMEALNVTPKNQNPNVTQRMQVVNPQVKQQTTPVNVPKQQANQNPNVTQRMPAVNPQVKQQTNQNPNVTQRMPAVNPQVKQQASQNPNVTQRMPAVNPQVKQQTTSVSIPKQQTIQNPNVTQKMQAINPQTPNPNTSQRQQIETTTPNPDSNPKQQTSLNPKMQPINPQNSNPNISQKLQSETTQQGSDDIPKQQAEETSTPNPDDAPKTPSINLDAIHKNPSQRSSSSSNTPRRDKGPDLYPRLSIEITPDNLQAFLNVDVVGLDFGQVSPTTIYTFLNSTKLDGDLIQYNKINELMTLFNKIRNGEINDSYIHIQISQGTPVIPGLDGWVKFYFPHNQKVVITDDDKADFRNLERYVPIKKADKIATVFMGIPGQPGKDVLGTILNPDSIKKPKVVIGSNIYTETIISPEEPDKTYIDCYSGCNGVLYSSDEAINVSEELRIVGNVGLNTGNINYIGSVTVDGSVEEGSTVSCTESLIITENLESSDIEVGADLVVKAGIKLKSSKVIKVKGNVKAKFLENAILEVDGDVIVESFILNCKIFTLGSVVLTSQTGSILGSEIIVYGGLSTINLGSNAGVDVLVDMGYHYRNEKLFNDLANAIKTSEKEMSTIVPQVQRMNNFIKQSRGKIDDERKAKFKQLYELYQKKNLIHKKLLLKYEELKTTRFNQEKIHLMIKGAAFPGVTIKYRRQIEKIQVMQTAFMMSFFPGQENAPMTAISVSSKKKKNE